MSSWSSSTWESSIPLFKQWCHKSSMTIFLVSPKAFQDPSRSVNPTRTEISVFIHSDVASSCNSCASGRALRPSKLAEHEIHLNREQNLPPIVLSRLRQLLTKLLPSRLLRVDPLLLSPPTEQKCTAECPPTYYHAPIP